MRWNLLLITVFFVIGLVASRMIINHVYPPKPAVLAEVTNSVTVGQFAPQPTPAPGEAERFFSYSLFGYTSSYATVRLEGIKLLETTKARNNGYFEFNNFLASSRNVEFCLTSIDTENLVAAPLCIPVPIFNPDVKYGPYLLPPSLKLAKGNVETNEPSQVSGKTIPGASVNVYVFSQEGSTFAALLIKPAYAQNTTKKPATIKLRTATDGSFSTKVTSPVSGKKRVFAQSVFAVKRNRSRTPKSVTLTINILAIWLAYIVALLNALGRLLNLNTLLLLQLLLIAYLVIKKKKLYSWYLLHKNKRRALVLFRRRDIIKAVQNYCLLDK